MLRKKSGAHRPQYLWNLDNTIDSVTGARIGTHVRDSIANYYHPVTGLLTEAAYNVCLRSREFDHGSWTQEGTPNPTANETGIFGDANAAYTITDNDETGYEYIFQSINVLNDSNTHCMFLFIKKDTNEIRFPEIQFRLEAGVEVHHSVQLNTKTGIKIERVNDGSDSCYVIDRDTYWQTVLNVTNNSTGNTRIIVRLYPAITTTWGETEPAATGSIIIDAIQVELNKSTPLPFIFTSSTANGAPRFENVGGHLALLVEPIGTNVCLRSREFDHGSWTQEGTPNPIADEIGIDGVANTAYTLTDNNNSAWEYIKQEVAILNDSNFHIIYIHMKKTVGASSFPGFGIAFTGGAGLRENVTINTNDGTITNRTDLPSSDGQSGIIDRGSFWQVWSSLANNSSGNTGLRMDILPAVNADGGSIWSITATGSIVIDAIQIELNKNIPSSFIFTEASAVTRATESGYPLWDLPPNLFDAQGTAIIWVRFGYAYDEMPDPSNSGIVTCRDNAASFIYNRLASNGLLRSQDATPAVAYKGINWAANTWYKLIVKWGYSTGKFRLGIDDGSGVDWGTEQNFDGSYDLGDYLRIGYDLFGPMHVRQLMLFRKALNDTMINHWGGTP